MAKDYHPQDIIDAIESRYPNSYPLQAGHLKSTLASVLHHISAYDEDTFNVLMEFQMKVETSMDKTYGIREMNADERLASIKRTEANKQ